MQEELIAASPDDDETVVLFRQVHQAPHDFPSQFPATDGVLVLFDEISKPHVESYRALLAAAGLRGVRTEKLESQVQAFCLVRAAEAAILETASSSSNLGQWARAVAALQRQEKAEQAQSHLRFRRTSRYARSST